MQLGSPHRATLRRGEHKWPGQPRRALAISQFDQPAGGGVEEAEPVNEEAETKLELARAYEEMGDKEGALELLEEVVSEGSPRQQVTARDMIARLG